MSRQRSLLTFVLLAPILGCNGIPGFLSPQDGTWIGTPTQIVLGSATYIVQISQDRMVRVNVNSTEWSVQQSNPATRTGTQIIWKSVAAPPAGSVISLTNIEYTFDVAVQLDGSLMGTVTQAIPIIPGVVSIPTTTTPVTLRRI
ncbi:MAG: hypothetical protein HZA51_17025 [Planctomycetes bacterium]|nr:hypothetical protein [Planctomycetota bacterium]